MTADASIIASATWEMLNAILKAVPGGGVWGDIYAFSGFNIVYAA